MLLKAGFPLPVYEASASSFWGLGKAGLITIIIVSVILIVTVAWLINGTKRRD